MPLIANLELLHANTMQARVEGTWSPSIERTRRHWLKNIVIISPLGAVAVAEGGSTAVLELLAGIFREKTLRRVFAAPDAAPFHVCFLSWARCLVGT